MISKSDYLAMLQRTSKQFLKDIDHLPDIGKGMENESELQREILDYCGAQWPRLKVIYPRMDKKSTLPLGAHDLTIFRPGGAVLCVECKARTGKRSNEQSAWAMEMLRLGHVVHIVRSMSDFMSVL